MLTFTDYNASGTQVIKHAAALPKDTPIESVEFTYDGGRVSLAINGQQVFYKLGGTDVNLVIDNKSSPEA